MQLPVVPAKAGTHKRRYLEMVFAAVPQLRSLWAPAFAGATVLHELIPPHFRLIQCPKSRRGAARPVFV